MSELSEILERFRRGPELVATVMTGAAGAELDFTPAPDKWSVRQIVCHLADAEIVGAERLRRTIAEDNPTLLAYDQDAWARNLNYAKRRTSEALETFRRLRAENYELIKDLPESAYARTATHSERGPMTLFDTVRGYAVHVEANARQLRAVREAYKEARSQKTEVRSQKSGGMTMTRILLIAGLLVAAYAQAPRAWTPELSLEVRNIGDVVPSPDGRLVAYTETRAVTEAEKSELLTQIFLARADGSRRVQLTRGEKSATSPRFSPDGRYVYFLSERSGKPNLWRIAVDGGEAEMLTDWKGTLGVHRISPDGKQVAFTGAEPPSDEEKRKKEKRDYRVIDEAPRNHSLWVMPAEADASGKRAPRQITAGPYHVLEIDWSPDSRSIAFAHQPDAGADYWTKLDLSEVAVESGAVRTVSATGAAEFNPLYSPDGRYLAYLRSPDPPRWAREERIVLVPRQGGAPRVLPPTPDESMGLLGWSADSSKLVLREPKGTVGLLYTIGVDAPARPFYQPERGTLSGAELNATGTHVGFAQEASAEAPEAYVMSLAGGAAVRVSDANSGLAKLPLGETKRVSWKAKDGLAIEGLLTYPVDYKAGQKYPLVLVIHGGPAGVFSESFIGRYGAYPIAALATRGYAVLRPNPRGSSGYGLKFRRANLNDWGGGDYEDLMAGVDHVIATGLADPERLAVMGWSYGGYMTSWVITHTKRFKAAAVGAGVTNLWSFTGTADIPGFLPDYFSGQPWENLEIYRAHSPMTFVKGVTTPTLILHGEADVRVPPSQGYELYNALKQQGVPVKMVVYPRTPHGPREPKFMLDIMQRHLDWVDKYVR